MKEKKRRSVKYRARQPQGLEARRLMNSSVDLAKEATLLSSLAPVLPSSAPHRAPVEGRHGASAEAAGVAGTHAETALGAGSHRAMARSPLHYRVPGSFSPNVAGQVPGVSDGTHAIHFRLFSRPGGGQPFYVESQQVNVQNGRFNTVIDCATPFLQNAGLRADRSLRSHRQISPSRLPVLTDLHQ